MANQFMAHFGPSYVETNHFGENNAIKYRLELQGSNIDSSILTAFVKINGSNVISTPPRGITAVTIDENGLASNAATFDVYGRPEHFDTLRSYLMSAPSNRVIALISYDAIKSADTFDAFMTQYGAVSWPGAQYLNKENTNDSRYYRSSYAAIFNTSLRRFSYENFVGNTPDKTEDTTAYLEMVFDTVEDVGACGIVAKQVDDINEYFTVGAEYSFKQYFHEAITSPGTLYYFKCELYRDQALINANGVSRFYLWAQDTSGKWFNSANIANDGSLANEWVWVEGYYRTPTPPTEATHWACGVYRWPSSVKVGKAGVRNVTVTRITRDADDKVINAAFGVNGMRSNQIQESVDLGNPVMQLLNLKPNNVVTTHELKERQ